MGPTGHYCIYYNVQQCLIIKALTIILDYIIPIFNGRMQRTSWFSIFPEVPYLWNVHLVILTTYTLLIRQLSVTLWRCAIPRKDVDHRIYPILLISRVDVLSLLLKKLLLCPYKGFASLVIAGVFGINVIFDLFKYSFSSLRSLA